MYIMVRSEGKTVVDTHSCQAIRVEFYDEAGLPTGMLELSLDQAEAIAAHLAANTVPSAHSRSGRELK